MSLTPKIRPQAILTYITAFCDRRGVFHQFTDVSPEQLLGDTQERKKTTIERKLLWIESAVSPSVRQIVALDIQRGGQEFSLQLLKALGIAASPIIAKHVLAILRQVAHGK